MIYATAILGVLLAISAAGNAWQFKHGESLLEAKAAASQLNADTKVAAAACSKGVEDLGKAGRTRQSSLVAALKGVAPKVAELQAEALQAGRAKPGDPSNLCASAGSYLKDQIRAERGLK